MYQRFHERNSLENQVKQAKIDRNRADGALKAIIAREVKQREALEATIKAQAAEHR